MNKKSRKVIKDDLRVAIKFRKQKLLLTHINARKLRAVRHIFLKLEQCIYICNTRNEITINLLTIEINFKFLTVDIFSYE